MKLSGSGDGGFFCFKYFEINLRTIYQTSWKLFNSSIFIFSVTTNFAAGQIDGDKIHSIAGLRRKLSCFFFSENQIDWNLAKILFMNQCAVGNE